MTIEDLTKNRESIITEIRRQVTLASNENIKGCMNRIIAILPQYAEVKGNKANVMKLVDRAITNYLRYYHNYTTQQGAAVDAKIEARKQAVIVNL
jgi:hypothetical protein